MKTKCFLIGFIPCLFFMISCDYFTNNFNKGIKIFFKDYTENANIELLDLEGTYPVDNEGYICIPSGQEKILKFYLRNPTRKTLNAYFEPEDNSAWSTSYYTIFQNAQDPSLIELTLKEDCLENLECGGDLSGTITYYMSVHGSDTTAYEPYKFKLRCNSEPPAVRNLTILQTDNESGTEYYVLAFNMPDMSTIHRDISSIIINGKTYPVELGSSPSVSDTGLDSTKFFTSGTSYKTTGSGNTFAGQNSARALYFVTDQELSEREIPFEIIIKDKAGLSTQAKASAKSRKLSPPVSNVEDGELYEVDESGYFTLSFDAPSDNPDAYVYYEVRNSSGVLIRSGHSKGRAEITLAAGSWSIESWAHKSGFVDSSSAYANPLVSGAFYYNKDYSGDDMDGSKLAPYNDIDDVMAAAIEAGIANVTVILQSDLILDSSYDINNSNNFDSFSINGMGVYGIKSSETNNYTLTMYSGSLYAVNLKLCDINIKAGASIYLSGSTHSAAFESRNAIITLENETSKIYVISKTGTDFTDINYLSALTNGQIVIYPASDSVHLSDNTLELYTLKMPGFFLSPEEGYGIARKPGIVIEKTGLESIKVALSGASAVTGSEIYETSISSTVSAALFDSDEKSISADISMALYVDDVCINTSSGTSIKIASSKPKETIYPGIYTLYITFEYDQMTYSTELVLKVSE